MPDTISSGRCMLCGSGNEDHRVFAEVEEGGKALPFYNAADADWSSRLIDPLKLN